MVCLLWRWEEKGRSILKAKSVKQKGLRFVCDRKRWPREAVEPQHWNCQP